ncbi:RNA polymerase sigma factor [Paenibacillus dendritiformis]|uniref:RNA polymerase sigma factor n=1 Tax=Paenibacillus dendritiformis TaxID=130049 RepID=UPI001059C6D4|nr:RNA polymerase sigma factor [Paenibacillus dendritiformis]TDL57302.1 RNA polymerase sigma factor [Paenibacillus dendritiformis]WGU94855.1 RNA polymerase sigma factor [Paenibacillus dendritiformis]
MSSETLTQADQYTMFELYYERVYSTAYMIIKDRHWAQDITQETFMKAFAQIHTLHDDSKLGAWLQSIAARNSVDFLRKRGRWNDVASEDSVLDSELAKDSDERLSVEQKVERKIIIDEIFSSLKMLKPKYQVVFRLKYFHHMTNAEIAAAINVNQNTVRTRVKRAQAMMQKMMRARHD